MTSPSKSLFDLRRDVQETEKQWQNALKAQRVALEAEVSNLIPGSGFWRHIGGVALHFTYNYNQTGTEIRWRACAMTNYRPDSPRVRGEGDTPTSALQALLAQAEKQRSNKVSRGSRIAARCVRELPNLLAKVEVIAPSSEVAGE